MRNFPLFAKRQKAASDRNVAMPYSKCHIGVTRLRLKTGGR